VSVPPATAAAHHPTHAWAEAEDGTPSRGGLTPESSASRELAITAALTATGILMLWAAHAWQSGWPVAVLLLATLSVPYPRGGDGVRLGRALAISAAGGIAAVLDPTLAPLALLCSGTVVATYPLLLLPGSGRVAAMTSAGALAVPLLADTARGGTALGEVLDHGRSAVAFAMLGGIAVFAAVSGLSGAAGQAVRAAAAQAAQRARDAHRVDQELTRLTTSDPVTGLPNREALLGRATTVLAGTASATERAGLLLLELDRFDTITAGFGPEVGEEVLRQIARRLRASRPAEDQVSRVDGARFTVLVERVGPQGISGVARRLQSLLEEPVRAAGRELSVTCAIGVALSGPGVETAEELLRASEEALHAARLSGRSRWAAFDQAMRAHSVSQATLELELRDALRRHDITLAFQPVVTLGGLPDLDQVAVVEALARWTRSDGTAVPPQRFVHLAEDLGLGPTLGFQVLDRALEALASWRAEGLPIRQVVVNVSRSQLEDPEFAATVSTRLSARSLPPSSLAIDIGPDALVESEEAVRTMDLLRSLGVDLALDDFGRAGSPLAALRQLPVGTVKIDRTVTADLGHRDAVPRAVIGLCHDLGLRVIVEGVETAEQLNAARALGAEGAQGFHLGRPVRAQELWTTLPRPKPSSSVTASSVAASTPTVVPSGTTGGDAGQPTPE
jgi:diguanylate cyclase (GGDEF)-like protein